MAKKKHFPGNRTEDRVEDLFLNEAELRNSVKQRAGGFYPTEKDIDLKPGLIFGCVVALLTVLLAFFLVSGMQGGEKAETRVSSGGLLVSGTATVMPLPADTPAPAATATTDPAATARPTMVPTVTMDPAKAGTLGMSGAQSAGIDSGVRTGDYLPIVKQGDTQEKIVAITVDDCFQINNLKELIQLTYDNGGKLTIFPIGENVLKTGMKEVLSDAVFSKGFEIENHTFGHDRIFRMDDEDAFKSIWKQTAAVNYVLGVNYEQHFYRFMGGDGETCQRSNVYLRSFGYKAIAHWTWSGSDATLEQSEAKLKPGMIYLFHTTDRDTEILRSFIPYCVQQGYRLVTMNEMFGLEENKVSDLATFARTMPEIPEFEWDYSDLSKGNYSWRTVMIQDMLYKLGYLDDEAKGSDGRFSGYYGDKTVEAVMQFQKDHGIQASGIADWQTQSALLDVPEEELVGADGQVGTERDTTEQVPVNEVKTEKEKKSKKKK